MSIKNSVHVVVAVIRNSDGHYLIAKRPKDTHQGGLWEFPGGKVESTESAFSALKREIFEELDITISNATPLIQIQHDYGDKSVFLDVFSVIDFKGNAFGKEGQEVCWVTKNDFSIYDFPNANKPIITAIQLPDKYMITGKFDNESDLLQRVQKNIEKGIKLIQFRAPDLDEKEYFYYAKKVYAVCEKNNVKLLLNTSVESYKNYSAKHFSHGIHFNSNKIKDYSTSDFTYKLLISTSTHNLSELVFAENKTIDFVVLSPVQKTLSHPDSAPLGWDKFKELTNRVNIPVYALGGMTLKSLNTVKSNGGQGIAAIGEFWNV